MWVNYNRRAGFTIVELLIVIVVIGILAAITIVAFNGVSSRANDASARSATEQAARAIAAYSVENADTFPATLSVINVNDNGGTTFSYSVDNSSNPRQYCISATVGGITYYENNTTTLTPTLGRCTDLPTVTTLAGSGTAGSVNGAGTGATFSNPEGIALYGGNLFVADRASHRIRKVTLAGVVTTLAGSGTAGYVNGTGTAAQFNNPAGIAVDSAGNLYVADAYNHSIRKVTQAGVVTTLAGNGTQGYANGSGSTARFDFPEAITVDSSDNIYVADTYNYRIRKITTAGAVTTLAGSGAIGSMDATGISAQFNLPYGITTDSSGNIFVGDTDNHRIREITPAGVVTTVAGSVQGYLDATGTAAKFYEPYGLAFDQYGNLYITDASNNRIRKMAPSGVVTTIAGSNVGFLDAIGTNSQFSLPTDIVYDQSSNSMYVTDYTNNRIRKLQ